MRGLETNITDIRRKVFTEVARLAQEGGDYGRIEQLPYTIIPGEIASYRDSIFLERAIVGERLRLAIGLPLRDGTEHAPISNGIDESAIDEKYYDPPLVNIIKFACHACPEKQVRVTDACQGCLAHPCTEVCPVDAVSIVDGRSVIDQDKCIKCGKCVAACPYSAIVKLERPCARACGVDAISSDELGRARIDHDKCVSCGMCLVNCPFGAIADKGRIFQTGIALRRQPPVYAAVAPAFAGQFGPEVTEGKLRSALQALGFADVYDVSTGADLCTIEEAEDFLKEVPDRQPFMATSCCPAWSMMAKKNFPEFRSYISMALTPMVLTGRLIEREHPGCKVVFIGPCAAKKLEASRSSVRSDVDFVLTFEELLGMFEAAGIDPAAQPDAGPYSNASGHGRGFAVSGGVAAAVVDCIRELDPARDVQVQHAEGLRNCRQMLLQARRGVYDGQLLEGMACPGGCVGGAGTVAPIKTAAAGVARNKQAADYQRVTGNPHKEMLEELQEREPGRK